MGAHKRINISQYEPVPNNKISQWVYGFEAISGFDGRPIE